MSVEQQAEWRDVPGYEGTYWVSSFGQVKARRRKGSRGGILQPTYDRKGYPYVSLQLDRRVTRAYLHILTAAVFIGPRPDGMVVRHGDGDPANPMAANLSYGTQSDNEQDKIAHGRHNNARRTHCKSGHAFAEYGVKFPSRPTVRHCSLCRKRWQEISEARRAA